MWENGLILFIYLQNLLRGDHFYLCQMWIWYIKCISLSNTANASGAFLFNENPKDQILEASQVCIDMHSLLPFYFSYSLFSKKTHSFSVLTKIWLALKHYFCYCFMYAMHFYCIRRWALKFFNKHVLYFCCCARKILFNMRLFNWDRVQNADLLCHVAFLCFSLNCPYYM
jgi:hypothetical protein